MIVTKLMWMMLTEHYYTGTWCHRKRVLSDRSIDWLANRERVMQTFYCGCQKIVVCNQTSILLTSSMWPIWSFCIWITPLAYVHFPSSLNPLAHKFPQKATLYIIRLLGRQKAEGINSTPTITSVYELYSTQYDSPITTFWKWWTYIATKNCRG